MIFPCTDLAISIQEKAKQSAQVFAKQFGRNPCLAVVLVGDDPASQVYVKKKGEAARQYSIDCQDFFLKTETKQDALEALVDKLNKDTNIDGILVQAPLPQHLDEKKIQSLILPNKDVDGFHPQNAGHLLLDTKACLQTGLPPCTPSGVMEVLFANNIEIKGKHAVVIGRSNIVGKPMALMLLAYDATVTICHSKTKNLEATCRQADILVSAIGKAKLINQNFIKNNAVIIDVGINRKQEQGKNIVVGDVDLEKVKDRSDFITPVPKGIGPMTIAMLLRNTVRAAHKQKNLPCPI